MDTHFGWEFSPKSTGAGNLRKAVAADIIWRIALAAD